MDISRGNAATQRRLRLELAGADSPAAVAKAVRTQLATIARASTFVDWQHRRAVVDDLPLQRRAIVDTVAPRDPVAGLDLMWRFLALAGSVFARCEDSSGTVIGVFDAAVSDLGQNPNSRRSNCSWSPVLGPRQQGIEALRRRHAHRAAPPPRATHHRVSARGGAVGRDGAEHDRT